MASIHPTPAHSFAIRPNHDNTTNMNRAAVISVPHFEWPRLEKHRLDLLRKKLAQAGLEPAHFLAARKNGGGGGGGKK